MDFEGERSPGVYEWQLLTSLGHDRFEGRVTHRTWLIMCISLNQTGKDFHHQILHDLCHSYVIVLGLLSQLALSSSHRKEDQNFWQKTVSCTGALPCTLCRYLGHVLCTQVLPFQSKLGLIPLSFPSITASSQRAVLPFLCLVCVTSFFFSLNCLNAISLPPFFIYFQPLLPALLMLWLWVLNLHYFERNSVDFEACFSSRDRKSLVSSGDVAQVCFHLIRACVIHRESSGYWEAWWLDHWRV